MAMVAAAVANGGAGAGPLPGRAHDPAGRQHPGDGRLAGDTPGDVPVDGRPAAGDDEGRGEQRHRPNAAIRGAKVGGKTGTAQHGLGNSGTPYAWFVSWAQGDRDLAPQVAVAVVVEDAEADRGDISGGGDAAPIARAVMEAVLKSPGRQSG